MDAIWKQRQQVKDIARAAGAAIMPYFKRSNLDINTKLDDSPVTEADFCAHKIIEQQLAELTPDIPLLSEESDEKTKRQRRKWQRYWLVDPLDGTKEFIAGKEEFSVNIALIDQGKPVFGVIYAPVFDTLYFAGNGTGAWKQSGDDEPDSIQTKPPTSLFLVAISSRTRREPVKQLLQPIRPYEFLIAGSSLKMCYIAEGEVDIYPRLGATSEWDTAAAQIILEQAGGAILNKQLKPLTYNQRETLINPHFLAVSDAEAPWLKRLDLSVMK